MFSLAEFTARDGVPEAARARYYQLTASLEADPRPSCFLETFFAAEVLRATWRVQRLAAINAAELADDVARAETDRATDSARKTLRWAMSQLRELQTDREMKEKLGINLPGIADLRQILKITGGQFKGAAPVPPVTPKPTRPASDAMIGRMESMFGSKTDGESSKLTAQAAEMENLKKRTHLTPRNAPCPCRSGEKQ